nr:MAG TPA: hypothetical protein [Caudoviricetes sp.]DAZ10445.1 MAG TPA: hypothetical protein [Caudoviricetes sp.]
MHFHYGADKMVGGKVRKREIHSLAELSTDCVFFCG